MFTGTALSVRLLVYAGLSLFIISGPYLYMVVCVFYAYNLTLAAGACMSGGCMPRPPRGQNSWHTLVKTLPSRNYRCWRQQEVAGSSPFTVMANISVTEFSGFYENIQGKLNWKSFLLYMSAFTSVVIQQYRIISRVFPQWNGRDLIESDKSMKHE